jgi:hypothetical protein
MHRDATALADKIRTLSPDQIGEVEDFVEFLRLRRVDRGLSHSAAALSAPAFEAIWANPEDDAYDAL